MTAEPAFAHLHMHSGYSLTDGLAGPEELVAFARERGITALALTDQGNLFGFISFYKAALKAGIKPICGLEVPVETADGDFSSLVLLVRNMEGYKNLLRLVSRGYTDEGFDGVVRLRRDWLRGGVGGLAALSCGLGGEVGQCLMAESDDERALRSAQKALSQLQELFAGEFYLEVHRLNRRNEDRYLNLAVQLSARMQCPLVATNDVRFLEEKHFETHEIRACIARKEILEKDRQPLYETSQYLTSAKEMQGLFADLPEAFDNALTLARRCSLELSFNEMHMPFLRLPDGQSEAELMRKKSLQGLKARLGEEKPLYQKRLDFELEVIERMGFTGYFLVVEEFVNWARNNGVTVGPGRGSGAGALVSWLLGITDLDPIEHGLLFERFLNPERVSPPDLDIDFDPVGRGRVISHVIETYGRDAVAQIATLDFAQARGAIRDVVRVLGRPAPLANRICEQFPVDQPNLSLAQALKDLPGFQEMAQEEEVREILQLAEPLEGIPRNASRHAGGIVIAPGDIVQYAPLFRSSSSKEEWVATQYNKKDLEVVGLVKFDFLGLTTLGIIDDALAMANEQRTGAGEKPLKKEDMDWDDPAPYELFCRGETEGLFQLESPRMRTMIRQFAPRQFSDLVALLALIRPGPLEANMFKEALRCRNGEAPMSPPHPLLTEVVADTWGVMLYQEQVMEAARRLADYSYGQADELRRAMGTKDREEMARHESIFVRRAGDRGIAEKDAQKVFWQMEKFAGYGFNKSHSAAYAVLSFQTAWLKAHYPACFMAATLTQEFKASQQRERRRRLFNACGRMGLSVLPPDVNRSRVSFSPESEHQVRFGLGAIVGVGEEAAGAIVAARQRDGDFQDIYDFCLRVGLHRSDSRQLEILNNAGALYCLKTNPARIEQLKDRALLYAEQKTKQQQNNQMGLFAESRDGPGRSQPQLEEPEQHLSWTRATLSRNEKAALGIYLRHHPLAVWRRELENISRHRISDLAGASGTVALAGRLDVVRPVKRRRGGAPVYLVVLDDETGSCELIAEEQFYMQNETLLKQPDTLLWVEVQVQPPGEKHIQPRMQLQNIIALEQQRLNRAKRLVVAVDRAVSDSAWQRIAEYASQHGGDCPLLLRCQFAGISGDILLPETMDMRPEEQSLELFRQLFGGNCAWFEYND